MGVQALAGVVDLTCVSRRSRATAHGLLLASIRQVLRHPGELLRIWGVIWLLALPLYSPALALPDRLSGFLGIAPERLDAAMTHLAEFAQRVGIW